MQSNIYSIITGTGSYIPEVVISNDFFRGSKFYDENCKLVKKPIEKILATLLELTGIEERRYARPDQVVSDLAVLAAEQALASSSTDLESLDLIIIAHNFGDYQEGAPPPVAETIGDALREKLGILNPDTEIRDLFYGCPGWIKGIADADAEIKSGRAKKVLVIGAELMSCYLDPYSLSRTILADGAGAVVLEPLESEEPVGILSLL